MESDTPLFSAGSYAARVDLHTKVVHFVRPFGCWSRLVCLPLCWYAVIRALSARAWMRTRTRVSNPPTSLSHADELEASGPGFHGLGVEVEVGMHTSRPRYRNK
jgi:hypothetical protein